ncbi:sssh-1 [Pristionchus pacificus]|uniref:Sssh-1 n=1 Tax=Pristionchus pacificus TaxID=54126 RepID=A0A2A6D1Y3_PRIPA|nr:sssh-1 [Pristionchus pacificus]|eukprot:PDM84398.1 sssh-1 [Pristionchus pacificus]
MNDLMICLATVLLSALSVRAQKDIRCYSCTTMDAEQLLQDVQTDRALRSGVRSQVCDNGVCMKMWFQQKDGKNSVLQEPQMFGEAAYRTLESKSDLIAREYPVRRVTWKCARATVTSAIPPHSNYHSSPLSSSCHGSFSDSSLPTHINHIPHSA